MAVTVDEVLAFAADFERSYVAVVYGRIKLRVGSIVYVAFDRDETEMGFAFPKEERQLLVGSDPGTFLLPRQSDLRFNWVCARMGRLAPDEMQELVLDAWTMVVPKFLSRERRKRMSYPDDVA